MKYCFKVFNCMEFDNLHNRSYLICCSDWSIFLTEFFKTLKEMKCLHYYLLALDKKKNSEKISDYPPAPETTAVGSRPLRKHN